MKYLALFSPFLKNINNQFKPYFDDSNRVARIFYRYSSYLKIFTKSIYKGVPINDLLRAQFPFAFEDASHPPIIAIELTNVCNLKCPYCVSPLGIRDRGYMSLSLVSKILEDLKQIKNNRIQLVGNGEPTLHPHFGEIINELAKTKRFVSIVTNGQWIKEDIAKLLVSAPIDLVEISIDAGGKELYEKSRINGDYDKLIANLNRLKSLRDGLRSETIINIRLMVRPSQLKTYFQEMQYWKQFGDRVMPQYLTKVNNTTYEEDLFIPVQSVNKTFPKCSMPFKHLEIKWTGEVLMCYYTQHQIGAPGLVIGNVNDLTIHELWNCKIMKQYREAHRKRIEANMEVCKGCPGT